MHRTDTLDMFALGYGEVYLVTDTDEVLLRPGDTKGVNHAWSKPVGQALHVLRGDGARQAIP